MSLPMKIDLNRFCADVDKDPLRPYLNNPMTRADFDYATNGNIIVRMPTVQAYSDNVPLKLLKKVEEMFAREVGELSMLPAFTHEPPLPCRECDGLGYVSYCPNCDGEGTHTYDPSYSHDCESRNGEGTIPGFERECRFCDGNGTNCTYIPVIIGPRSIALRYVSMIRTLPNVRVDLGGGPYDPMYFVFDGGDGIVMPMRI